MVVTMHEAFPLGLCMVTESMLDAKRFLLNFCDNTIIRDEDQELKSRLKNVKKELNGIRTQPNFFDGYKTVILDNIDKIIGIVKSRFEKIDPKIVGPVVKDGKEIMKKVLNSQSFDDLVPLSNEFKRKITLRVYELYLKSQKPK
ncbi:MAG TPA: hypothetical protein ENG45_01625 [Candidatus Aenigmarchaeota archaeon]|nr:hypothetical protein [Candidatus Aenigmarchaeota archaeon]